MSASRAVCGVSKPFATAKYKGVTEAWAAAVADINKQRDMKTGVLLFDPPISVKAVRDRFDAVMKIAKEIQANVPFRSGKDDEEEPTPMMQIIDDLLEMKTSFESIQTGVKDGTLAKKKKDGEAVKSIQQASLGGWVVRKASTSSSSESESDASKPKKKGRPIPTKRSPMCRCPTCWPPFRGRKEAPCVDVRHVGLLFGGSGNPRG
jgi:hypothetical protein